MGEKFIKSANHEIVWDQGVVTASDRQKRNRHQSFAMWFTGLSGSGKSTVANALEYALFQRGKQVYRLDGDNLRHGLNADLGFSKRDREENIRRVAEVTKILVDAGNIVLATFISPTHPPIRLITKRLSLFARSSTP